MLDTTKLRNVILMVGLVAAVAAFMQVWQVYKGFGNAPSWAQYLSVMILGGALLVCCLIWVWDEWGWLEYEQRRSWKRGGLILLAGLLVIAIVVFYH